MAFTNPASKEYPSFKKLDGVLGDAEHDCDGAVGVKRAIV